MIQPYFNNIATQIIKEISEAKTHIAIVMAWFTDEKIFDALRERLIDNVKVDLILLDDESNKRRNRYEEQQKMIAIIEKSSSKRYLRPAAKNKISRKTKLADFKLDLKSLEQLGAKIFVMDPANKFFIHSKFCVIDSFTVITGSYNWTKNAYSLIENIVIIKDSKNAFAFLEEFARIKEKKYKLLREKNIPKCGVCKCFAPLTLIFNYVESTETEIETITGKLCTNQTEVHFSESPVYGTDNGDFDNMLQDEYDKINERELAEGIWSDEALMDAIASYVGTSNDILAPNLKQSPLVVLRRRNEPIKGSRLTLEWNHPILDNFMSDFQMYADDLEEKIFQGDE